MIPQCNPRAGYLAHKEEIDIAIERVLKSGWYILGKEVKAFEEEFADWLGVSNAVGVANGTDAIELALRASGIGPGDLVATVSHTAVATVAAIYRCGAQAVFVDIEPDFFTMSPASLEELLVVSPKIKAIVVVHLYGQMAAMTKILSLAQNKGVAVIEDCAQAHGAELHDKKAGSWGDFAAFSFYPTKNLAALGDAGAVVSNKGNGYDQLCRLRQYGWDEQRISREVGVNSRLDELQAAVLRVRLQYLNADNAARQRIAAAYSKGLINVAGITLPTVRVDSEHVYHQFVIQTQNRDLVQSRMRDAGVLSAVHYAQPIHAHPAYCNKQAVLLSNTEEIVGSILSLPMFPEMSVEQVSEVVEVVKQAHNR